MYVLKVRFNQYGFNEYYTGDKYVHHGTVYAVVDSDIKKAKVYKTLRGAEKGAGACFDNYIFEIVKMEDVKE